LIDQPKALAFLYFEIALISTAGRTDLSREQGNRHPLERHEVFEGKLHEPLRTI